jgi:hypothetical protein
MIVKEIVKRDLTGIRFGRLVVIKLSHSGKHSFWECLCDCGKKTISRADWLKSGEKASCGCLKKDYFRDHPPALKHGHARKGLSSSTYGRWKSIIGRCMNPSNNGYHNYGGRGISVCERWLNSFENFLADMGECPAGLEIERKNNDGNYELGNCIWATRKEQANNKRTTIKINIDGQAKTLKEWSEYFNIRYHTVYMRLKRGCPLSLLFQAVAA